MKAIVVIDMQDEYIKKYDKDLILRINSRILKAKHDKEFIIYIKNVRSLTGREIVYEFASALTILSDNVFHKKKASIFSSDMFSKLLSENNIKEIELVGIDGNSCIAISLKEAINLGYSVKISCQLVGVKNDLLFNKTKDNFIKLGAIVSE